MSFGNVNFPALHGVARPCTCETSQIRNQYALITLPGSVPNGAAQILWLAENVL